MPGSIRPKTRHPLRLFAACFGLTNWAIAHASSDIETYQGTAFDSSGRVLYKERHSIGQTAGKRELVVLFECPDGKPFARKHVRETEHPDAPLFALEDARTGYREGVRDAAGGSHEVYFRTTATKPEQSAPIDLSSPGLVVDAGFDHFIHGHWDALATGARQRLEFVVPNRLRAYSFSLSRVDDELRNGKQVRRFLLAIDAWYAFAIPTITFVYSLDSQAIVEYEGVSSVRDARGKALNARIEFSARSKGGDGLSLEDALAAHLDGECAL